MQSRARNIVIAALSLLAPHFAVAAATSHAATSWATAASSVTLQGNTTSQSPLASVQWVNQYGQRGRGTWASTAEGTFHWTVAAIPLRAGVNLISVIATDSANKSASVQYAINRTTGAQQSLPIRSGFLQSRPIVYQLWAGRAVIEGDLILSQSPASLAQPQRPLPAVQAGAETNGLSISYTSQLWPIANGIHEVPYIITGSSSALTTALGNFNQQFAGLIEFVPRSSQPNYVNITVNAGGSTEGFSNVGMVGDEQALQCGSGCTVATWLHEMGHTVGLLHEHQRPDRSDYITLNLTNADLPNVPGNFTLFPFDYQTVGLYDYASVMHYASFDFSKAGLPVLESIPAGIPLSNNTGYSAGDVDQIKRLYGATPSAVTVTTNPQGLRIIVDGATYTAPQTFTWALNSSHTLNLPADPQNTNPADGSTYAFGNWNDQGARSHTITLQPGSGTLTAPSNQPAVTVYQANFVRLQPFAFMSPAVYPSGSGTVSVSPSPTAEYGGQFFVDRTLVTLTLTPASGTPDNFYDWFNLPYPPSANPLSFYIQEPLTQAQGVMVPTPVTIVGASITGPNTWNPGVSGTVDGEFTYLPTGFASTYDSTWTSGSPHTIAINQTQSPVTTNVYFNWNSWSDAGGISHSITQPSSGTQSIFASLTPFYATYTVPPPLGAPNPACYGGVSTSPAPTSYTENSTFDFYADGTSVRTTATANSNFPFAFEGWAGTTNGLMGTTNPDTQTVDDQFVPTATFNVAAAPLSITSFIPSSISATSAPMNVTINGTGFTNNDTYVNWNGSSRSATFVSASELTLNLNAGDLAQPGEQDVYIGNYVTNGSGTCSVNAESSLMVTVPGASGAATAAFAGIDTTTEGTWTGSYGADGYMIANDTTQLPSYATVSVTHDSLYTWAASTSDPRAPQTASGAATRTATTYYAETTFTFNINLTDGNTHRIALYLLDWTSSGRAETISIVDAASNAVLSTESFSSFHKGEYAIWNVHGHVLINVTSTGASNAVVSGIFFGPGGTAASASFDGTDTTTKGTWTGHYGSDGFMIAADATQLPSYAAVSITGDSLYTWAASTADPRALQTASGAATRIASTYYAETTFTFNINLTDGNTHRIALYLLDWTSSSRAETISVMDASTNAVLSTQSFSSFHNGAYAIWNVRGHVLVKVTSTGASNGVVSAVFFDANAAATYTGSDTTTEGTWTGSYGADGYMIASDTTQLPSYADVSVTRDSLYTWAASTSDPRALQTSSGAATRIASTYYSASTFTFNVNLTDDNTHRIALYLVDWTGSSRAETISIVDATTNAVLSTESFASFHNGEYAIWSVHGHVLINVTSTGLSNAVVSGVFFN